MEDDLHILHLSGCAVRCRVRRHRRSGHFRLTVRRDGVVVISVPGRLSREETRKLVRAHEGWILRRLSLLRERQLAFPPFRLEQGAALPLWGQVYRLHLEREPTLLWPRWRCADGRLVVSASELSTPILCGCVVGWYKAMARRHLRGRIAYWAGRMEVAPRRFAVKNQHSLWGSCSRKGNLNINWRIMLLAPEVADYLLVHELAHLREANHSPRFWALVARFCPRYRHLRRQLASLNHWLGFPEAMFIEC
ncbi:MAG: SprT family zinc-dependent metalloprotease [bacterium]|jgi:predicted metal-dependent hydrolase|nr:M48 family metallopeptidase [candidate division KSB1 bacterium]MDH7560487.1 SprT family zinc-dependent metalloprotease [bacterium]